MQIATRRYHRGWGCLLAFYCPAKMLQKDGPGSSDFAESFHDRIRLLTGSDFAVEEDAASLRPSP